jgi:hypothetical protein
LLTGWGTTGTFAVISILVGNICLQLAPESKFRVFNNATNESYVDTAAMEADRLHVSATLACLTAIIQVRPYLLPLPHPRPKRTLKVQSNFSPVSSKTVPKTSSGTDETVLSLKSAYNAYSLSQIPLGETQLSAIIP